MPKITMPGKEKKQRGDSQQLALVTIDQIKSDYEVKTYISKANDHMASVGLTEHGFRHVGLVSHIARNILTHLNYPAREAELAAIAGYLHDIGNFINRYRHGHSGALLALQILSRMGMPPEEIAVVVSAVGNHDEEDQGQPVNSVAASLIIADKSDVHRTRVRNNDFATFDIHDRVNYAVNHSFVRVIPEEKTVTLELTIDTEICPVMDYFEIFLARMVMCRRAASFLHLRFQLLINDVRLL